MKEIDEKIEWVDSAVSSSLKTKKQVSDIFEKNEQYFIWLYEKTILFQKVFGKYIREFKK